MGIIALLIGAVSALLLWDTPHDTMWWIVVGVAVAAWYIRRVVASLNRRGSFRRKEVHRFWQHAAVISFWASVIVSSVGIYMALQ